MENEEKNGKYHFAFVCHGEEQDYKLIQEFIRMHCLKSRLVYQKVSVARLAIIYEEKNDQFELFRENSNILQTSLKELRRQNEELKQENLYLQSQMEIKETVAKGRDTLKRMRGKSLEPTLAQVH
jgi:nucleoid-associated protein YejK